MSSETVQHISTGPWSNRLPDRERVVIPPLSLEVQNNTSKLKLDLGKIVSHEDKYQNIDFLNEQDIREALISPGIWQYDQRHQAQAILPFLFIGELSMAKKKDFLVGHAITMILTISPDTKFHRAIAEGSCRVAKEDGYHVQHYFVNTIQQLVHIFPQASTAINRHLVSMKDDTKIGRVLICCENGNVQAPALAAAYLVENLSSMTSSEAIQLVSAKRFSCAWEEPYKHAIADYAMLVQARRNVQADRSSAQQQTFLTVNQSDRVKRGRSVDEDEDMEDADDFARFEGRQNTPFLPG